MKNIKLLTKINHILLIALILIQPIINIIRTNIINDIQLGGISVFEIINIIIICFSVLLTLLTTKNKKRYLITIIIYAIIFLTYVVFHSFNILKFNLDVYENSTHDYIKEIYYLIRMFCIPTVLIILLYFSDIKKETCFKTIEFMILFISLIIIICNVLKLGQTSYSTSSEQKYSIFNWFTFKSQSTYNYYVLTCKGIFGSANQLSAIFLMISPLVIYRAYSKKSVFNYFLLITISLAMLMLGTKTANLGIILVYISFFVLYAFFRIIKKERDSIKNIIIIFTCILLLFIFSPVAHKIRFAMEKRYQSNDSIIANQTQEDDKNNVDKNKVMNSLFKQIKEFNAKKLDEKYLDVLVDFINTYQYNLGIPNYVIDNYKIDLHKEFWCEFIQNYTTNDYRRLKTSILENIFKENDNSQDIIWGIGGNSLGYIYTESDYSYQIYSYGIIGFVVFIGIYVFAIPYLVYKMFKNNNFNFEYCIHIFAPTLGLLIAYYSGHVLERNFPLLVLAYLIGINFVCLNSSKQADKKVLFIASTGGHLNELLQLSPMFSKYDYHIITEKDKTTYVLKDKYGDRISYLKYGTRSKMLIYPFVFLYNCIKSLLLFMKLNPKVIITTGTHTAVPMCYIGKIFGSKIVFIETFANRNTKTLSGKLVYPIADLFIVQWEEMKKLYPKAIYGGAIY